MRKRSSLTAWHYLLAHGSDLLYPGPLWDAVRDGRAIATVETGAYL